ncbi:hypothetical protein SEUCBS139899_001664 [Sporothrix eucalyptigena]|uniref:Uncharacterized protein n=1 Tax=Sporothrix eucalyptigena TaxID=1812306 RepID=A0ABP0BDH9_9PEZI
MPGEAPLDHFSILERRRQAALVLSNPEMLMMYAQSMNDSIPSVRMRFTRILCGLDRETLESPAAIADWAEEEAWEEAEREAELMFPSSAFDRFSCRTLDSYGSSTSSPSMGPSKRRQSNNVERPTRRPWRGQPPKLL